MNSVKEIMTSDPVCCTADTTIGDCARMMCENDVGELPVVESNENPVPVGVVTDRDIVCRSVAKGRNPIEMSVGDCMSTPAITMRDSASVDECCGLMEENQIRRVVVVDDAGRCCGIVSQADIALKDEGKTAEVVREVSQPAGIR